MQFKTNLFAILISGVPASLACGKYEFYGFDDLPESAQKAAEAIGYVKKVWNAYGANKLEKLSYDDLALDPDTLKAIVTLDLVGDNGNCWDHYINHYQGYSWDDLAETTNCFNDNLQDAAATLGWTKDLWDEEVDEIAMSECKGWYEFNSDEKAALVSLGWTPIKWNAYPLDPRCPDPEPEPEDEPEPKPGKED